MPTAERNKKYNGMTKAEFERRKNIFEKSGPFYKVLQRGPDGKLYSCSGGEKCWGDGNNLGAQWEEEKEVVICQSGLHVTNNPMLWHAYEPTHETFEVEIPWQDKSVQITDLRDNEKIAVSKMRLLRPIDPRVLAQYGLIRGDLALEFVAVKPEVNCFRVQSGTPSYSGSDPRRFEVSGESTLEVDSFFAVVRAYERSNIIVSQGRVDFQSSGTLTAGAGSCCDVRSNGTVVARTGSVVTVVGGTPRIYAEDGAVVVLRAGAYVVKAPNNEGKTIVSLHQNYMLKNSRLFAVANKFGQFIKFVELDSSIPADAKIIS